MAEITLGHHLNKLQFSGNKCKGSSMKEQIKNGREEREERNDGQCVV